MPLVLAFRRWRRQAWRSGDAKPRQPLAEYNTGDARDLFSHLLRRVRAGEEIVIAHAGRPVAKLIPYSGNDPRRPGVLRAQIVVHDEAREGES